jgi:transposase
MPGLESLSREDLLALVAIQQRQIEDLKSTVGAASDEVERLRSQLGRNSGKSSMPPSSDGFVKPERRKKPSSGRPKGKQPGSPGAVVDAFPPACGHCVASLEPAASRGFARRQCHDTRRRRW